MEKTIIVYSKIACIVTLIESLYLYIGFLYPTMLKDFDTLNIIFRLFFYFMGSLFFVCYLNAFLLFLIGIVLLFTK